jgi:DNA-binding NarL/FixJ family response regulator
MTRGRAQQLRDILEALYELDANAEAAASGAAHVAQRARGRRPQSNPREASAIWQAIVAGQWSLVEQFDSDGHRCFLARKNDRDTPVTRALSERERQIVAHASLGHSNKHIAYELGLCSSTVAAQLTSAARKLGVSSREAMLHAFAVLGGGVADRGGPAGAATPAAQRRDDEPVVPMARFRHDGHEYAVIRIAITPQLPASLTAAETEVATLVIEGLSNAAIAARRNTSVRTVANQLRSIYSKLAVGSRRQLCSRFSLQRDPGSTGIHDSRVGHPAGSFTGADLNYSE